MKGIVGHENGGRRAVCNECDLVLNEPGRGYVIVRSLPATVTGAVLQQVRPPVRFASVKKVSPESRGRSGEQVAQQSRDGSSLCAKGLFRLCADQEHKGAQD